MPDTPENQAAYPQPSNQKKGCGFPMMKVVGLFSLASGALLHFARGTLHVHESLLFRQLWDHLYEGDVLLGDRGFCSFFAIASLLGRGVDSVMRLHQARRAIFAKANTWAPTRSSSPGKSPPSGPPAAAPKIRRPARNFDSAPDPPPGRVKGWRSRTIIIVTTLLDPQAYPAEAVAPFIWSAGAWNCVFVKSRSPSPSTSCVASPRS